MAKQVTKDEAKVILQGILFQANAELKQWQDSLVAPAVDPVVVDPAAAAAPPAAAVPVAPAAAAPPAAPDKGPVVLEYLKASSKIFNAYISTDTDNVKIDDPTFEFLKTYGQTIKDGLEAEIQEKFNEALGKLTIKLTGGGKKNKGSSRKLKGGNQVAVVKEFGAPNTNLIYNASGLITSAKDPVAIGMTGTERLIDTHAPFATGMESGAFSGMHNLPASITSEISPALGFMGGAHSKTKRATKSRK